MRFGLFLPQIRLSFDEIVRRVRAAEAAGFDSVWLVDHLWAPGMVEADILEAWTTLAALAARSERIRLGHMVLCNGFRHPALLAKMAATVDRISGGRLELGLGWGSVAEEIMPCARPAGELRRARRRREGESPKVWRDVIRNTKKRPSWALDGGEVSPSIFRGVWAAAFLITASLAQPLEAQVNGPPELAPIGPVVGSAGVLLRIELSAQDPEGGPLRFEVGGAPAGVVLTDRGDGTAECSWLPAPDQVGNHSLTFTVHDDGTPAASDSENVLVTIGPRNRPPVLSPIGNRQYEPGVQLAIELAASDPDLDAVFYSVSGGPGLDTELEDLGDGTGRWYWFAPEGSASYEVTFTVTDTGEPSLGASETIVLSPAASNRPPELLPIGNRRVRAGEALLVTLSASDPDGDALAFSAAGLPDGAALSDLGGGAAELHWTPSGAQVGTHSLVVAVADDGVPAEVDSEALQVTVEAPPAALSGDLRLDHVRWHARGRFLYAVGSGARPRETVALVDAGSGALLGATRANGRGRFGMAVAPFLVPCAVSARVLDAQSASHPVRGAPEDCGQGLLTRVREVRWSCKRSELRLEAGRAPAGGLLEVRDASSGKPLGSVAVDHHGHAHGSLALAEPPERVRLRARSGEGSWELGAFHVQGCRERCEREERHRRKGGR